jgi:putative spermidine/putrescine transport system substrate-binding protein
MDQVLRGLTRRRFGTMALGGSAALAMGSSRAIAQNKRISVVVSAIYKRSFDAYIVPKMKELHGIDVAASTMLSAEALARAIGQRSNPQISLFTMDQGPWQQGKDMGLWAQLDASVAQNAADVPERFRDKDGKGLSLFNYLTGFCYDEEALKAAGVKVPEKFFDMWLPEFRNRVVLPQFTNTFAYVTLEHTTRMAGGNPAVSFDAGFSKLVELKPNIRTFIGPLGQLIQLFQQKEIWLAFAPQLSALQAAAAGLPVRWKAPSDGAVALSQFIAIPEGAPAKNEAALLANLMLSPEYQKVLAQTDFMVPSNTKVQLDADFAARFPVTPQITSAASQVSWTEYNKQRVALSERWQREIQA